MRLRLSLCFCVICFFANTANGQCSNPGGNQSGNHGGNENDNSQNEGGSLEWSIPVIVSRDPNDITGLKGYLTKQWLSINDRLKYTVRFENDPKFATAPAQNVFVYLPVEPKININSLTLGSFGFGRYNFEIPDNQTYYTTRLDVRDSLGLFVDFIAGIDITQNRIFWSFKSIDPATGQAPTNALSGFLPVNDSTASGAVDTVQGKGEGYVRFLIKPESTLTTGDSVSAKATIIFDTNEEIETNTWVNAIDAFAPVSQINSYRVSKDTVSLNWLGQDDANGTGVKEYALYVSQNGGTFSPYETRITDTSGIFVGTPGNTYSFFTLATDNVGNREALKTSSNITVFIPNDNLVTSTVCPFSNISFSIPSIHASNYQWQVDAGSGYQNISNSLIYEGAVSNLLVIKEPPTSWYGYKYRCQIVNANGVFYSAVKTLKFSMNWKGVQNNAWEEPLNWSCNKVPDENTDVIINTTIPVRVNADAAVRSIVLYPGAHVTISSQNKLDVKK